LLNKKYNQIMRNLLITLFIVFIASFNSKSQTCVGLFKINLLDGETQKQIGHKVKKSISYVFTGPENEFYNDVQEVLPFEKILKNPDDYKLYTNEGLYKFISKSDSKIIEFLPYCGEYLVQIEFLRKQDTMQLGIYNFPAHLSFEFDSLEFKPGDFYIDLESTNNLNEFEYQENNGIFIIPLSFVIERIKEIE